MNPQNNGQVLGLAKDTGPVAPPEPMPPREGKALWITQYRIRYVGEHSFQPMILQACVAAETAVCAIRLLTDAKTGAVVDDQTVDEIDILACNLGQSPELIGIN